MATIVLSIEGVLADSPQGMNTLNYEVSISGRVLYNALRDSSRLVLLSNDTSKDRVKAWLAREHFSRYADVHCYSPESGLDPAKWRVQHTKDLIGVGHHIAFYIDSDPTTIADALEAGVGALLFARSGNVPGRQGKERIYSPWYDLVDSIEAHSLRRASRAVEVTDGSE